ncbi:MAG: hypothetical protein UZ22_OP11002001154 [Microgenomates bacterium OLB23]|nr:MAG: hypothetical protein UZ22_OP11002001154 [Microgenomates bacterium OLB23]
MKKLLVILASALVMSSQTLLISPIHAQTTATGSQILQVSPARHTIEVEPGESLALVFKFYNLSDKTISGTIKSNDFIVINSQGTPQILDSADQILPKFSGANWTTLPFDRMSVAPGDKADVRVNIKVPTDARPGGRYVAVYFEPTPGELALGGINQEEAGASIAQRIAGLIYMRVKGPVNEKAYISRLFGPSFIEYGPIDVETEILNRGDYHIRPRGSISAKNLFNATTDQKPLDEVNIFPDTSRSYNVSLGQKWMIGRYTINTVAAYGDSGQVIQRSINIWVFPWKIALAILLGLIILYIVLRYALRSFMSKQQQLENELKKRT